MRLLLLVVYTILNIIHANAATGDYHQVIDQLAKALSHKAQSVRNVTSLLNHVLDAKNRPNSAYHLPSSSYRPSANVNNTNNITLTSSTIIPTKDNKTTLLNERVTVPSQRLLNDILVVRSSRRLYVLVLMPIHESLNTNVSSFNTLFNA
jgi:hypothetical protein